MIYDQLSRIGYYLGLSPELDTLIRFIQKNPPSELKEGKTGIDGDNCWISRSTVPLAPERALYEMHKRHLDIHIPLTAGESIAFVPSDSLAWNDTGEETLFTQGPEGIILPMEPGAFALFFPWDAHRPSIGRGTCEKAVGKALRNWKD